MYQSCILLSSGRVYILTITVRINKFKYVKLQLCRKTFGFGIFLFLDVVLGWNIHNTIGKLLLHWWDWLNSVMGDKKSSFNALFR